MILHITQEDIDKGIRGSSCYCPIALAAKRAFGIDSDLIVDVSDECIELINGDYWWSLSDEGLAFIDYFDNGTPVHPMAIECIPHV